MPDDCLCVGFGFFNQADNTDLWIADDHAVEATGVGGRESVLVNEIAYDAAFDNLGRAAEAVQEAAERKSNFRLADGSDFNFR
jgi:hypothetical protein